MYKIGVISSGANTEFIKVKPNGTGFVLEKTKISLKHADMQIIVCKNCSSVIHMNIIN